MLIACLFLVGFLEPTPNLVPTPLDEIGSRMILSAASQGDTTAFLVIEGRTASSKLYLFDYRKQRCFRMEDLRLKTTAGAFVYANDGQFIILDGVTRSWSVVDKAGSFVETFPFTNIQGHDSSKLLMFLASQEPGFAFAKNVDRTAGKDRYFRIDLEERAITPLKSADLEQGVLLLQIPDGSLRISANSREIVRNRQGKPPKSLLAGIHPVTNPRRKTFAKAGIRSDFLPRLSQPLAVGTRLSFFELTRQESGKVERSPLVLDLASDQVSRPAVLPIGQNRDGRQLLVFDSREEEFSLVNATSLTE